MVSWLFPPHTSIGARRAWRFARHLPSFGWSPTVLCRRQPPPSNTDRSDWTLPPEVTVVRAYDAEIFSRLQSLAAPHEAEAPARPSLPTPAAPETLERSLASRLDERWNRFVDAMVPCETGIVHAPHAASQLARLAPGHDVIWTTSYPYHSHVLGMRAARARGLPFVADLRDPWTPNWVHQAKYPHTRWIEARLERAVFEAARAIVVTTEALATLYRGVFPRWADKFVAIHNAFDLPPGSPPEPVHQAHEITLIHFGNVYGPWSLKTVFRALGALVREAYPNADRVRIENYGKLSDSDRACAADEGLRAQVRVLPPVDYTAGLARLRGADLLLLAAWDSPDARLYLQGKLYDYLLAARPLMAESDNPELARIVAETGAGEVVAPGDVNGMKDLLRRVISKTLPSPSDPDAAAFYSARECSRRLGALLDRVALR